MSVSENLKAAVAARNCDDIRGGLWSCIAVDMNMTGRFKESLAYVLENGISEAELYEADDGAPFATAASAENFSALGGLLRVNFSKKKLDALRTMGRTLYPPHSSAEEPKKNQPAGAAGAGAPRDAAAGSSARHRSGAMRPRADGSRYTAGGAAVGAGIGAIAAAKLGAKIGGIIGGGVIGAVVGACIGAALAGSSGGSAGGESGSPHREV